MIVRLFGKRRLNSDKLANVFVNGILDSVDNSFPAIAEHINEDPEFISNPDINNSEQHDFLMIVLAGNLKLLSHHFAAEEEAVLRTKIVQKLAVVFSTTEDVLESQLKDYNSFMSKVNHPSKNVLYGMSKAVFFKYELGAFQDDYFREMNSPNPLFLKRLDELIENFLWDWNAYLDKIKLVAG